MFEEVPAAPPAIAAIESTVKIASKCSTSPSLVIKSASAARPVTVPMVSKKSLSNNEKTARPAASAPIALNAPNGSSENSGLGLTNPKTCSGTAGMFSCHPVGFSKPAADGSEFAAPIFIDDSSITASAVVASRPIKIAARTRSATKTIMINKPATKVKIGQPANSP